MRKLLQVAQICSSYSISGNKQLNSLVTMTTTQTTVRTKWNIKLRPATITDARALAHLWVSVFPDKFRPTLGQKGEAVLREWFHLSQRRLQMTTMAQVGRQAVGFITLETPASPCPNDGRLLWYALQRHNGLWGALRGLLLMGLMDQDHQQRDDEVYIEMLGVAATWQGCGVASCLMRHAETVAHTQQAKQLCLTVMMDNTPAVHLYEKHGFYVTSEQRSRILEWVTGHIGYYEMVKPVG